MSGPVARTEDELEQTVFEVELIHGEATAFVRDLTDLTQPQTLVNDVEQQLGPVDILINNAGVVAPLVPTAHLRPVAFEQAMRPNFLAPVIVSAAVLAGMRDRGWGRIVDVSSGAVRGSTHQTSHDATGDIWDVSTYVVATLSVRRRRVRPFRPSRA